MGVIYSRDDFDPNDAYPEYSRVEQLIMEIAQDRDLIYNISPREFEEIIERVFQDEGFETTLTQQTRDGGRDIIATKFEMGKETVVLLNRKKMSG
jgi:HJR/Mrr/RecB family endonuclease